MVDDECPANVGANAEQARACVDEYGVQIQANQNAHGCGAHRRGDGNVRVLAHHDCACAHGLPSKATQHQREKLGPLSHTSSKVTHQPIKRLPMFGRQPISVPGLFQWIN